MTDTITITNGPHELAWQPLDVAFGGVWDQFKIGDVTLQRGKKDGQHAVFAERPSVTGEPFVTWSAVVDGKPIGCTHGRGRRTLFIIGEPIPLNEISIIAPNTVNWGPEWKSVPPMGLGALVKDGQSWHDTGDAPEHGAEPACSNDAEAAVACGMVLCHCPVFFRDPVSGGPIITPGYAMGPNKWTTKNIAIAEMGVKFDNAHAPSLWWAALEATRGTLLERFFYEAGKFSAVFHIQSDWPGELERKPEVRMQRATRNVARLLLEAKRQGDNDAAVLFCRAALERCFNAFEGKAASIFTIKGGTRNSGTQVALWEYAQLAYALYLCELVLDRKSAYLEELLDWTLRLGERLPYVLQIGDSVGPWSMDKIKEVEDVAIATAKAKKLPRTRYHELCLFDWVRFQRDMPTVKPLESYTMLDTANWAGFRLPWKPKPKYVVTYPSESFPVSPPTTETFQSVDDAKACAKRVATSQANKFDGSVGVSIDVLIEVT